MSQESISAYVLRASRDITDLEWTLYQQQPETPEQEYRLQNFVINERGNPVMLHKNTYYSESARSDGSLVWARVFPDQKAIDKCFQHGKFRQKYYTVIPVTLSVN